jgi:hypothetical protein
MKGLDMDFQFLCEKKFVSQVASRYASRPERSGYFGLKHLLLTVM